MANLNAKSLEEMANEQFRIGAAQHGLPMREEVRSISEIFRKHFGAENGVDLDLKDFRE